MKHYARSRAWCEWDDFAQWQPRALQALDDPDAPPLSPFQLLSLPGISAGRQRQASQRWMAARLQAAQADRALLAAEFNGHGAPADGAPLRIGYLSNDFHQHATALLMVEMLEAHDARRFELHAYSHGADDGHGMRQRLQASFAQFHSVGALDDVALARAIHADGIHILVDLKGYTAGSRSSVLGLRPAPLQVSFLGYPGTLADGLCDYLITDHFVTPAADAAGYSEALACLPHSYQPHGAAGAPGPAPTRAEAGLPEDGLVLCCFNQAFKFTPDMFDVWCRLLDATPGSVLWLLHDERAAGNLRAHALSRGVAPHRLVFAPDAPQDAHLARLQLADLVLDTAPYNAHTTASDALWAGVPLVTWAGDTFAGRVAGSLLHAVGLPELVTHSLAGYEALAQALLADVPRLQALRGRLQALRAAAPLFDVVAYTRALEALYTAMWQRHAAGLAPQAMGAAAAPVSAGCAAASAAPVRTAAPAPPACPGSRPSRLPGIEGGPR